MDLSTFIITVYCLVEEWLREQPRLRQRGGAPAVSDGEVLTMESAGSCATWALTCCHRRPLTAQRFAAWRAKVLRSIPWSAGNQSP